MSTFLVFETGDGYSPTPGVYVSSDYDKAKSFIERLAKVSDTDPDGYDIAEFDDDGALVRYKFKVQNLDGSYQLNPETYSVREAHDQVRYYLEDAPALGLVLGYVYRMGEDKPLFSYKVVDGKAVIDV